MRMCRRRREVIAIVAKMAAPAAGWPIAEAHALAQVDPLSIGEERAEMLVRHVSARPSSFRKAALSDPDSRRRRR